MVSATALVVATGGKFIPKIGATGLTYDIAAQFGLATTDILAALLPTSDLPAKLRQARSEEGRKALTTVLSQHLPARLIEFLSSALSSKTIEVSAG